MNIENVVNYITNLENENKELKDKVSSLETKLKTILAKVPPKELISDEDKRFLKSVCMGTATRLEIVNVMERDNWEEIRSNAIKENESLHETLKQCVKERVFQIYQLGLFTRQISSFCSVWNNATTDFGSNRDIYSRYNGYRLNPDYEEKVADKYNPKFVEKYKEVSNRVYEILTNGR